MSDKISKKLPGRPKKVKTIPESEFRRIIRTPESSDNAIEFTYTEPHKFNKFIKTFKSCNAEDIHIFFHGDKILFKGKVTQNNTSAVREQQNPDKILQLEINASNVYSYYIEMPYIFHIKITELASILDDMDESCSMFKLIYSKTNKVLSFTLYDATTGCRVTHQVPRTTTTDINTPSEFEKYDALINTNLLNSKIYITNIRSENLKKILGKTCRKNCPDVDLESTNNKCTLTFKQTSSSHHSLVFDSIGELEHKRTEPEKKKFIVVRRTDELFTTKYPNIDIHKFILHTKDTKMRINFSEHATIAIIDSQESQFTLYIPCS